MEKHVMDLAIERKVVVKEIPVEGAFDENGEPVMEKSSTEASIITWNWIRRASVRAEYSVGREGRNDPQTPGKY